VRTFDSLKLGTITDPASRDAFKKINDYLRGVSGALSKSVFSGQQPPANPVPSGTSSTTPPAGQTVPAPVAGDLLFGLQSGAWAKLAIGASGTFLKSNGSNPGWSAISGSDIAHNLLSTTHTDTLAGTVVRGDLIVGNSTPAWSRFAKGTAGTFLKQGANDPAWTGIAETDIADGSLLARVADAETISGAWTYTDHIKFDATFRNIQWGTSPFATLGPPTISTNTDWRLPIDGGVIVARNGLNTLTGQTGSISDTVLATAAANGMFRYNFYLKTTTAGAALDVVKATVKHNDGTNQTTDVTLWPCTTGTGAITPILNHDLATANFASFGHAIVYSLSGQDLKYSTTVTKTGSPQYTIIVRLEALT
jgi:hypothetical protein